MLHAILMKIFEHLLTLGIDLPEPMVLIDPIVVEDDLQIIEQNLPQFEQLSCTLFEMITFIDEVIFFLLYSKILKFICEILLVTNVLEHFTCFSSM